MTPPSPLRTCALALILMCSTTSMGCAAVVSQDEVGIKRTFGKLQEEALDPGLYFVRPVATRMMRLPINTQNVEVRIDLPSQEGLTVESEISILYRIDKERAHDVLRTAGRNYEEEIILSIFRSAAADVCSKYMAKDMHSGERSVIEHAIQTRMTELLEGRGFIVEAVLMKSIKLPAMLSNSIEARMAAEQDAMRMKYVLEEEEQEVERKIIQANGEAKRKMIEAKGERDAQLVMAEGLTPEILRLRAIEAFLTLATSPNTKVVLTPASGPLMLDSGIIDAPASPPVPVR